VGAGYFDRDVLEDALANFQRALELEPGHVPALLGASVASTKSGNPAAGLDLAQRALTRSPQSPEAHYLAGLAAEALGRRGEALGHFRQARALQPQQREYQAALERVMSSGR
jgi:tetratricopeptide (TPR) repeat protein